MTQQPLHKFMQEIICTNSNLSLHARVDIVCDNARTVSESERRQASKKASDPCKISLDVSDHTKKESRWDSSPKTRKTKALRLVNTSNRLSTVTHKHYGEDHQISLSSAMRTGYSEGAWRPDVLDIVPSHVYEESALNHVEQALVLCSERQ